MSELSARLLTQNNKAFEQLNEISVVLFQLTLYVSCLKESVTRKECALMLLHSDLSESKEKSAALKDLFDQVELQEKLIVKFKLQLAALYKQLPE